MEVETKDEATTAEEEGAQDKGDRTTWYPYITKTQFEKFLSRLQNKIPEEINRDYVRAIIRTPSMIYRFLRGIEAMKLIDREQRPTERLQTLVAPETRRETLGEIVKDLYPGLLQEWDQADGKMSDRDIVSFFRKETGMGNDSANKMKMFFKYLQGEAQSTGEVAGADAEEAAPTEETKAAEETQEAPAPKSEPKTESKSESRSEHKAEPAEPAEALRQPAPQASRPSRGGRDGNRRDNQDRGGRDSNRRENQDRGGRDNSRQDDQSDRGGRDNSRQDSQLDRSYNSRVLSEAQRAYLDTLKSVLKVNIDGDWDDDMIRLAFDRLERLFDRVRRG